MRITKEHLLALIGESAYNEIKNLKETDEIPPDYQAPEFKGKKSKFARREVTRRVKHQKGSAETQAGGLKTVINFQPIYANKKGELDYGTIRNRPKEWEHVGWRVFEKEDIFFIGDEITIEKFLEKYNLEIKKIIKNSGLEPENVRYTTKKLTKYAPRVGYPTQGLGRGTGLGAYKTKGILTKPITGKGDERYLDTRYMGGGMLSPEEKAAGLRTSVNPFGLGERTKRFGFMEILRDSLAKDGKLQAKLIKSGFPMFVFDDRDFLNRYSDNSTIQKFEFTTHAFNYYKNMVEFNRLQEKRRAKNADLSSLAKESMNLARQFNQTYENYSETQATLMGDKKITPVYNLDARAMLQDKFDVMVESIFQIQGQAKANTYVWTATFIIKFGRRLEKEIGDLLPKYDLASTVKVKTTEVLDDDYFAELRDEGLQGTIMDVPEIVDGLRKVLDELKEKIMNLKGLSLLQPKKKLKIKSKNINPQLNETNMQKIISGVINQLDNLKPL